jgi:murein DD-endopeptidase MepM/ murein hydrolase activator NlpD
MRPDRDPRASPAGQAAGSGPRRSRFPLGLTLGLLLLVVALLVPRAAAALAATALSVGVGPVGVGPAGMSPAGVGPAGAGATEAVAGPGPGETARVPPLWLPLAGPVVRGYEVRAGPFGPGHRGVDLAGVPGAAVRAPAAGRVIFAGRVAATTWVSIQVAQGVVVTLGPLRALTVTTGQRVAAGAPVADLAPGHRTAEYPVALHLGLRVDGAYVDPLPWLTGFGRPRLAPLRDPGGPH